MSYLTKNFNYLCNVNVEEWHKIWIYVQCSAKALEEWGQMTLTTENYEDVGNFFGVTYIYVAIHESKFGGHGPLQPK